MTPRSPAQPTPGGVRLSVVLPAFREAEVIGDTLAALRDGLSGVAPGDALELIVVDDGSDDATVEGARAAGADRVIALDANRGKGAAVRTGMLAAAGDAVVFTDADLQYPPDRITAVLARLEGEVGAVIAQAGAVRGRRRLRRLGTRTVSRLARTLVLNPAGAAGHLGADTQCGLKVFRRPVAQEVFGRCRVDRFGFDVEVLALLALLGVPVAVETVAATAAPRRSSVRVLRDGGGDPAGPAADPPVAAPGRLRRRRRGRWLSSRAQPALTGPWRHASTPSSGPTTSGAGCRTNSTRRWRATSAEPSPPSSVRTIRAPTEVVVGRDMRLSGPPLVDRGVLRRRCRAAGLDVVDLGLASTDMLYFAAASLSTRPAWCSPPRTTPPATTAVKACRAGARPLSAERWTAGPGARPGRWILRSRRNDAARAGRLSPVVDLL